MAIKNKINISVKYIIQNTFHTPINNIGNDLTDTIINEIELSDCYIKIVSLEGDKHIIKFRVARYTDDTQENLINIQEHSFVPSVSNNSENFIKQAYGYLKILPEYEGAVDVLEEGQML